MLVECSICANKAVLSEDHLCQTCGEAIKRLVWIAEQESVRQQLVASNEGTESAQQAASPAASKGLWQRLRLAFVGRDRSQADKNRTSTIRFGSSTPGMVV